jgi:hypothetical protein
MKNLKTMICLLVLVNVFALGCKKDSEKDPGGNKNNKYSYQNKETKITEGKYNVIDVFGTNTVSLILIGNETSQWVQLFFYKSGDAIPEGNFIYKDNSQGSYNPLTNFAGGSVNLGIADAHEITGGSVSVNKEGSGYSVTVDATTSRGPLKGSYTGSINKE